MGVSEIVVVWLQVVFGLIGTPVELPVMVLPWVGLVRKLSWFCVVVCGDHSDGPEMGHLVVVGDVVVGMERAGLLVIVGAVLEE